MESADFESMRRAMVDGQLRTSGVTDAWVLAAMGSTPREDFVPEAARSTAYMDRAIVLPDGSVLNPPEATGLMLQAAEVRADDNVLFVGAADGYVATLLKTRAAQVAAIQTPDDIAGDGYSLIFIDGAIEELPDALVAAAVEGGRIVTGLNQRSVASLAHGIVRGGKVALRSFRDSGLASLAQFARKTEFVF